MKKIEGHIGIDFGGTKIEGVVLNPNFEKAENIENYISFRERIDTEATKGYEHLVHRLANFIKDIIDRMNFKAENITIGIGLPGSIIRKSGRVKNSNTTCLNNQSFWTDVQNELDMSIVFENDANCFALAEAVWGAGKTFDTVFGVILGTGVGGGIIINKQILSGLQNIAGEWGHSLLLPDTRPCYCGKKGCIETFLSGTAFNKYELKENNLNMRSQEFCIHWDSYEFIANSSAQKAVDQYCRYFGMAISNIINILDPEVIILGGGMSNASFIYSQGLEYIQKYVFNDELLTVIKKATLGDSAGVFGAAYLGATSK